MQLEILTKKHYEYLYDKYKKLYDAKMPWSVKELRDAMINDHISRVVNTMDEEQYVKEINEKE